MNFKKFISGVSALTIAASAFAGMAVTANAETLYSQNYESGTVDWTTGTSGRFTPVILEEDGNKYLSVDQGTRYNNGTTISSTAVSIAAGTDYTLSFDFKLGSSTNQTPAAFNIYDATNSGKVLSFTAKSASTDEWIINDGDTVTLSKTGNNGQAITALGWYTATLTRSGDKEYLTITDKADGTAVLDKKSVSGSATGGIGKFEFVTKRYNANFAIDNVFVRDVENDDLPSTPQGEYSVVYKTEGGTTLEKNSSGSGDAGSHPTLTSADKANFTENGQKYIYVSDDSADVTITANDSVVVTVTVRAAATYSYTVTANEGAVTLGNGNGFEGDTISFRYPLYININGTLYSKGATSNTYKYSFTLDTDNKAVDLTYAATTIEDVVFLSEAEDITGLSINASGNADARSSQAAVAYATEDTVITNLPAGKYKVYAVMHTPGSTAGDLSFALGENSFNFTCESSKNWSDVESDEITIAEAADLVFKASGSASNALDFIYVVKTGDATTDQAFTFTQPLSALQDLSMYVTRSSDHTTADSVAVSSLGTLEGTTLTGGGDAQLAIIFENVPLSWGTLSVVLK